VLLAALAAVGVAAAWAATRDEEKAKPRVISVIPQPPNDQGISQPPIIVFDGGLPSEPVTFTDADGVAYTYTLRTEDAATYTVTEGSE
jgi:hypothetical protein